MKVKCIHNKAAVVTRYDNGIQNENSTIDITVDKLYDVYGTREDSLGKFYLVLTDEHNSEFPRWMPEGLYTCDDPTLPNGWVKREKRDARGNEIVTCSYPTYFEAEEDIASGTERGVRMFAHMRAYPTEGYGLSHLMVKQTLAEHDKTVETDELVKRKEHPVKRPNEDEMMYLARTIAVEVIAISNTLPEIMQWRIGSALQGDVYEMSSSVAAAKGSVDDYVTRAELENARTKAYVVKNAIGILPGGKDSDALLEKIDQLVAAIDGNLEKVVDSIHFHEQEELEDEE